MPKPSARPAAPAVYSAKQVEAAHAKIHAHLSDTIADFAAIMKKQDHQLMQFRGLTALAKAQGSL